MPTTTPPAPVTTEPNLRWWLPQLASEGFLVPTLDGRWVVKNNFDHAASSSALVVVEDFVHEFMRGSSAIKRGPDHSSQEATDHYEDAREVARRFLGGGEDSAIVFCNNATGGVNTIAHVLNQRAIAKQCAARVVITGMEHNAMIVPFEVAEYIDLTILPVPESHDELLAMLDAELAKQPADVVGITGASNVTGEMPDLAAIAAVVHRHGGLLLADLAQLAPHHHIDVVVLGIDLAVLSGHKLGAPYGVGVLYCATRSFLEGVRPLITGGGIVNFIYADKEIVWTPNVEALNEPGSVNVVGALATAVAMAALRRADMGRIATTETLLLNLLYNVISNIPGIKIYHMWDRDHPKVGVVTFNIEGFDWGLLSAVLAGHFGIANRGGCFCAHILVARLLGFSAEEAKRIGQAHDGGDLAGGVRFSFGLDVTTAKVLAADRALRCIVERGPAAWKRWYEPCGKGHWRPIKDTRPRRIDFEKLTSW
jgi:selenocysteine lyase/cysteine desulfurase